MTKKINIIGLKKEDFDKLINSPEGIILRPARLIPFINPGKEEALASVLLRVEVGYSAVLKTLSLLPYLP